MREIKITTDKIVDEKEVELVKRLSEEFMRQVKQFENDDWKLPKLENSKLRFGKSSLYFFEFQNGKRQGVHGFMKSVALGVNFFIDKASDKEKEYYEENLPSDCLEVLAITNFPALIGRMADTLAESVGIKAIDTAKTPDINPNDWDDEPQKNQTPPNTTDATEEQTHKYYKALNRKNQATFRKMLLEAYNGTCPITKCKIEAALEAAHIIPFAKSKDDTLENGLLLRADLHRLFDTGFMSINPKNKMVHFKDKNGYYNKYTHAKIPDNDKLRENLTAHWQKFQTT